MKSIRDVRDTDHLSINLHGHDQQSSELNKSELHHIADHGQDPPLMGNWNLTDINN